jgi:hypothetical protein
LAGSVDAIREHVSAGTYGRAEIVGCGIDGTIWGSAEGVRNGASAGGGPPDHLAGGIDTSGKTECAPERAKVTYGVHLCEAGACGYEQPQAPYEREKKKASGFHGFSPSAFV